MRQPAVPLDPFVAILGPEGSGSRLARSAADAGIAARCFTVFSGFADSWDVCASFRVVVKRLIDCVSSGAIVALFIKVPPTTHRGPAAPFFALWARLLTLVRAAADAMIPWALESPTDFTTIPKSFRRALVRRHQGASFTFDYAHHGGLGRHRSDITFGNCHASEWASLGPRVVTASVFASARRLKPAYPRDHSAEMSRLIARALLAPLRARLWGV